MIIESWHSGEAGLLAVSLNGWALPAAGLVGLVTGWFLGRVARKSSHSTRPGDKPMPGAQRTILRDTMIEVRDLVTIEAVRGRILEALQRAGIEEISPDGQTFDPTKHHAIDRVPTTNPTDHNRVAFTERPGYRDGNVLVRPPDVGVYRLKEGAPK